MKNIIKISAIVTICIFFGVASSRAGLIIDNSLSDMTLSGTTATSGDAWVIGTGVTMANSGILTSFAGYNFGVLGNISTENNLTVNQNLNVAPLSTWRGFYVDFNLTESYKLSKVSLEAMHLTATGTDQTYSSDLRFLITDRPDNITFASGVQTVDYDSNPATEYIRTEFLTTETLAPGNYRLSIGMNNLQSGGAFASYDSLTIFGDVVPEPTVVSLLGLSGGIMIVGRRLRKRQDPEA